MLHMPSAMLLSAGDTPYDAFRAHIATLAVDGSISWTASPIIGDGVIRAWRTTSTGAFAGALYGSPWNAFFSGDPASRISRIIQHSLPEGDLSAAGAGLEMYLRVSNIGTGFGAQSQTRNGYASQSLASDVPYKATSVTDLIGWNPTTQEAFRMSPSQGLGPTPYTWSA